MIGSSVETVDHTTTRRELRKIAGRTGRPTHSGGVCAHSRTAFRLTVRLFWLIVHYRRCWCARGMGIVALKWPTAANSEGFEDASSIPEEEREYRHQR